MTRQLRNEHYVNRVSCDDGGMKMQNRRFIRADEGAVTIDWVALAAGLLLLGVGVVGLLTDETQGVVDEIEVQLASAAAFDPGFVDGVLSGNEPGTDGNGLVPGATYNTGSSDFTAGPGDYFADLNGDGVPSPGDLFVLDSNGDGQFDTEIDGAGSANDPDVVQAEGLDQENSTYTDSGKGTFSVTQLL
ncbi:MAG: hypothetical protein AAF899_19435 [Pseudomonadota bacterium]